MAFGLDYPDSPMPGSPSVQLVRLQPETFAVAVATGSLDREPVSSPDTRGYVELEALRDLDWILPPESSHPAVPSARASGAGASSHEWCTR